MYRVTVTWIGEQADTVYFPIEEYEVKNGVLTIALSADHDVVVPLEHVKTVDVEKE